jgi:hypothetical protein
MPLNVEDEADSLPGDFKEKTNPTDWTEAQEKLCAAQDTVEKEIKIPQSVEDVADSLPGNRKDKVDLLMLWPQLLPDPPEVQDALNTYPPELILPEPNEQQASFSLDYQYGILSGFSSDDLYPSTENQDESVYGKAYESTIATFVTASSLRTYVTAPSIETFPTGSLNANEKGQPLSQWNSGLEIQPLGADYHTELQRRQLIVPEAVEVNWSGKGQHVTFSKQGDVPLKMIRHLGSSCTAHVDKVLCRRIALARKTMRCSRQWKIEDALREVEHLHHLRHAHIVQLVGTYLIGRNFTILMYPAADQDLHIFLEDTSDLLPLSLDAPGGERDMRRLFLLRSQQCLISALSYIHHRTTKHMDIKPANILVKGYLDRWRVYMADFGLSRSFAALDHSQTDGPTARTPKYCAPEVYDQSSRGRSADIFSLGCVFAEMFTVASDEHIHDFANYRRGDDSDESFHNSIDRCTSWIDEKCFKMRPWPAQHTIKCARIIKRMITQDPTQRPTADQVSASLKDWIGEAESRCCAEGPEPYEAYTPYQAHVQELH